MSHQLQLLNLVLCLLLFFIQKTASSSSSSVSSFSSPSHSLLRAIIDDNDNNKNDNVVVDIRPHDYAVDLNFTNFDAVFRDTPATFAIVEFFAHWCPACRTYKLHYERVARLFNGPDAVHPGIIIMTRVDCGLKVFMLPHFLITFFSMLEFISSINH
ncbi:uncharacterized protein LOC142608153 [Castanea sativa]|uniref:uncharacterized protein LOC142608153 n=1 Tax=Castanea sativa TaxID=21020 RepID=UPI003F649563